MKTTHWARLLTYVSGLVNQELLLRNEYLAAENCILRAHLQGRLRLSDPERATLSEIGKRLGRKALEQIACVAKPDTILGWYRKLVAQKSDGSKKRTYPGRPRVSREVEELIVRFAKENSGWGYDRIVGALANLGHCVSDQTVGNILVIVWILVFGFYLEFGYWNLDFALRVEGPAIDEEWEMPSLHHGSRGSLKFAF